MAHSENNNSNEKKPVAYTTPMILGLVTVFVMLLFVSLGDPCHCEGACAQECAEACDEGHGTEAASHGEGHGGNHGGAEHSEGGSHH